MSKLSPYITLISVFILLVLGSLYVSQRFMWSIGGSGWIFYFLGFFFLAIFAYLAVFAFISKTDKLSHFIYLCGVFTMGFVLYFLISSIFLIFYIY
ncbi:hypothetical protein C7377_1498 [Balneicella halophila]|uniref:Uncharacterized protein n=1 Tax=Balneicella halophila TaxID=1537566 RepID=A0A7L4UQ41_BALHA|nr:hypothetical protein C7377_1498 [Balneicella halophila]